jgi:hypothetical protein
MAGLNRREEVRPEFGRRNPDTLGWSDQGRMHPPSGDGPEVNINPIKRHLHGG